ncbi:hypothetical protein ACPCSP_25490 [Streptomyces cinereoruber]|uniref:hypothetical protein n=1 Tax=Streptomyces cinereoruber TaxID=67260 RepID=UPI003C2DCBDF
MEAHNRGGIHVGWTRPTARDCVVSLTLGYLLYQEPSVPWWAAAGATVAAIGWIRVTRTV